MATRSFFVPVDICQLSSLLLTSRRQRLPFIYNTHAVLVFPLNHNKPIFRNVKLNNKKRKKLLKARAIKRLKVHSKMSAKWSLFCFRHGHDHVDGLGIVTGKQRESTGLPYCGLKRSAQNYSVFPDRCSSLG